MQMPKYLLIDVEKFMDNIRRERVLDDSYCEKWLEDYLNEVSMESPTNGDMVKAIWGISDDDIDIGFSTVYVYTLFFNKDWWNAPYKRGTE